MDQLFDARTILIHRNASQLQMITRGDAYRRVVVDGQIHNSHCPKTVKIVYWFGINLCRIYKYLFRISQEDTLRWTQYDSIAGAKCESYRRPWIDWFVPFAKCGSWWSIGGGFIKIICCSFWVQEEVYLHFASTYRADCAYWWTPQKFRPRIWSQGVKNLLIVCRVFCLMG